MGILSSTNTFERMGNTAIRSFSSSPNVTSDPFGNIWVDLSDIPSSTLDMLCEEREISLDRLPGRIAAQEAAASWLRTHRQWVGSADEVGITYDAKGRPFFSHEMCSDLSLSLSHCGVVGVARVSMGQSVGIDLEAVKDRSPAFERRAFSLSERELLPSLDRTVWVTRFWTAKEAAGKCFGTGLDFDPRGISVLERTGDFLRVQDVWVRSHVWRKWAIAWTVKSPV